MLTRAAVHVAAASDIVFKIGAEGGSRTHTGREAQRFLRPSRLPFRHFGQDRVCARLRQSTAPGGAVGAPSLA